ncbi:MAG: T9SS type A sorting domain-containing protein [Bacteroidetes bacterium]|nr:T9SS type A sorting domain-containing protein [Bacteroidota bacterium]
MRITGGAQGVTLTNTHVNSGGRLHVSCVASCGVNPDDYLFEQLSYAKINSDNNTNGGLPSFVMSDEFKQVAPPSVFIFPNPSNGIFVVESSKVNIQNIQIINALGQIVYKTTIGSGQLSAGNKQPTTNGQLTIDLSSHPKGIYFIKVQSGENVYTQKIILQ